MPVWKAYFASQSEAEAFALGAEDRALESFVDLATEAGQTPASATPTVRTTVVSAEGVPPFALPSAAPATSRVRWTTTDPGGQIETVEATMPTALVPGIRKSAGTVKFSASDGAYATFRSRVAAGIQVEGVGGPRATQNGAITPATVIISTIEGTALFPSTGMIWIEGEAITYTGKTANTFTGCTVTQNHPNGSVILGNVLVAINTEIVDSVSNKRYKTSAATNVANAGPGQIPVVEVDSSELGNVTYGTVLSFVAGPSTLVPFAQVSKMAAVTVIDGTALTSVVTGRAYTQVGGASISSSAVRLSGFLEGTMAVKSTVSDGASAAEGEELDFDSPVTNCAEKTTIAVAFSVSIPSGQTFTKSAGSPSYKSTAAVLLGDSREISVGYVADANGPASDFASLPTNITVTSPIPAGVSNVGSVTACILSRAYPAKRVPVLLGDVVAFDTFIAREVDGRWSVRLATLPLGT